MKKNIIKAITFILILTLWVKSLDVVGEFLSWIAYKKVLNDNEDKYRIELNIYNENIKKYADKINSLNLSDLEIIMKVVFDTWKDIDGYGKEDNFVIGLSRLAFDQNGKGVCTSFADDFTAKMNCINPKYKARNIIVYMYKNNVDKINNKSDRIRGNHMVTALELQDKKVTLIVDPTNLLIGFLKNGKIYLINSDYIKMDYIMKSTNILSENGPINSTKEYIKTYFSSDISEEELEKSYGYEAQQKALNKVLELKY